MRSSRSLDTIAVKFDHDNLVANAGLILPATLAQHLDLEALIDSKVHLTDTSAGFRPGRKSLTLVHSMIAGGDSMDDSDMLRAGSSASVLGHVVMAPSTLGTFLRAHTFGNVRQFDRVNTEALRRAWAGGAGPDPSAPLVIDIDSTICQVYGHLKQGAAFRYTKVRRYHPLLIRLPRVHNAISNASSSNSRGHPPSDAPPNDPTRSHRARPAFDNGQLFAA